MLCQSFSLWGLYLPGIPLVGPLWMPPVSIVTGRVCFPILLLFSPSDLSRLGAGVCFVSHLLAIEANNRFNIFRLYLHLLFLLLSPLTPTVCLMCPCFPQWKHMIFSYDVGYSWYLLLASALLKSEWSNPLMAIHSLNAVLNS